MSSNVTLAYQCPFLQLIKIIIILLSQGAYIGEKKQNPHSIVFIMFTDGHLMSTLQSHLYQLVALGN